MSFAYIALAVSAVATLGSAGVSAYSSYAQGKSQAAISSYNALIAKQNASLTAKQIGIAEKEKDILASQYRQKAEKTLAAQRAGWAKAGVTMEGTPLLVAVESMAEADIDALAIRYAGTVEQSQLLSQQAGYQQQEC